METQLVPKNIAIQTPHDTVADNINQTLYHNIENINLDIFSNISIGTITESISKLDDPYIPGSIDIDEHGKLLLKYQAFTGLTADLVEIYDTYMLKQVYELITSTEIYMGSNKEYLIKFFHVEYIVNNNLTPLVCRQNMYTYSAELEITAYLYIKTNNNYDIIRDNLGNIISIKIKLGKIPIMIGSSLCITRRHKMNAQKLFKIGECPSDPNGYFIIDGAEYICFIQDKLRVGKPICYINKGEYLCRMTSENIYGLTSVTVITKSEFYMCNIKIRNKQNKLITHNINVFLVFKILLEQYGYNTDDILRNIILLFVRNIWKNKVYVELLKSKYNVDTIPDVYLELANLNNEGNDYKQDKEGVKNRYRSSLISDIFPQYDDTKVEFKIYTLAFLLNKLVETALGLRPIDNRDSWSNKRLVTIGYKMYGLFSLLWNRKIDVIKKENIKPLTVERGIASITSLLNKTLTESPIIEDFISSFKTNWGPIKDKATNKYKITDILKRESKLSPWSHINRITTSGSKENRNIAVRMVEMTQYGFIDPMDTPEGKDGCGLTKNKSTTCWISNQRNDIFIENFLNGKYISLDKYNPDNSVTSDLLLLNGKLLGGCNGSELSKILINARRAKRIDFDVLILYESMDKILYISSDSGRPTRPLLIVDEETQELVIDKKNLWNATINELISEGCIEYIDAHAQEFIYIATTKQELMDKKQENINLEKNILELEIARKQFKEQGTLTEYESNILEGQKEERYERLKKIEKEISIIKATIDIEEKKVNQLLNDYNTYKAIASKDELKEKFKYVKYHGNKSKYIIDIETKKLERTEKTKKEILSIVDKEVNYETFLDDQYKLALYTRDKIKKKIPYTHCEISGSSLYGIAASIIPMANKNQAARVQFQCGMGRQALGIYHSNYNYRFDTTSKMLISPTKAIVSGQIDNIVGIDKYGHGVNVVCAIMSYTGFNQEDSLIFNKQSVELGLFNMMSRKVIVGEIIRSSIIDDKRIIEKLEKYIPENKNPKYYRHLGDNGIVRLESVIRENDCLISIKKTITYKRNNVEVIDIKDSSIYAKNEHDGYVVNKFLISPSGNIVKVELRDYRFPEEGDKFASRIAQKSTIGLVMNTVDMPFTRDGLIPDLIMHPLALPSRMTMSHIYEMLYAKAASLTGETVYAPAFKIFDDSKFRKILNEYGYEKNGLETMFSGMTGEELPGRIFIAPIYYQALKHHVKDKIQVRQRGARDIITHQPTGGKKKGGGIKFGEMERDALISHGVANVLNDIHCVSSNPFNCIICNTCKSQLGINYRDGKYECKMCGDQTKLRKCTLPYVVIYLAGLLNIMGANMLLHPSKTPKEKE